MNYPAAQNAVGGEGGAEAQGRAHRRCFLPPPVKRWPPDAEWPFLSLGTQIKGQDLFWKLRNQNSQQLDVHKTS